MDFVGRMAENAPDLEKAESGGLALGIEAGGVKKAREQRRAEQPLGLVERVLERECLRGAQAGEVRTREETACPGLVGAGTGQEFACTPAPFLIAGQPGGGNGPARERPSNVFVPVNAGDLFDQVDLTLAVRAPGGHGDLVSRRPVWHCFEPEPAE